MIETWSIPKQIASDTRISGNAKLVYSIIYTFSALGEPFMTNGYLSEQIGVSDRQINRIIQELEQNKFISIRYEKGRTKRFIKPLITNEILLVRNETSLTKEQINDLTQAYNLIK